MHMAFLCSVTHKCLWTWIWPQIMCYQIYDLLSVDDKTAWISQKTTCWKLIEHLNNTLATWKKTIDTYNVSEAEHKHRSNTMVFYVSRATTTSVQTSVLSWSSPSEVWDHHNEENTMRNNEAVAVYLFTEAHESVQLIWFSWVFSGHRSRQTLCCVVVRDQSTWDASQ